MDLVSKIKEIGSDINWKITSGLMFTPVIGEFFSYYLHGHSVPFKDKADFVGVGVESLLLGSLGVFMSNQMKKSERSKSEKEKVFNKLNSLTSNVPGVVYRGIPEGGVEFISGTEEFLGFKPGEFLKKEIDWFKLIHPEDVERLKEEDKKLKEKPIRLKQEYRIMDKSGNVKWVQDLKRSVHKDGKLNYIDGVVIDITEQKEDEIRFKELFNNMGNGVAIYEPTRGGEDFVFKDINKAGERISSVKRTDVIGKKLTDVFPGVKERGFLNFLRGVNSKGVPKSLNLKEFKDKQITQWLNNHAYKLPSGEVVVIYEDVTLNKKTEECLKESENKYKTLYESSSDAIMMLDSPSWRFTSGNQSTLQMFGCKDEAEFTSRAPYEFSPEYQPDGNPSEEKAKKMIMQAMEQGSNFFEWTHQNLQGEEFPATVLLTRLDLEGKQCLQATVRDITKQKEEEEEKERLQNQLIQAQKVEALAPLAGGIAHDFNNILTAILGNISFAKTEKDEKERSELLKESEEAVKKAGKLTKQLLTFSKGGKPVKKLQPIEDMVKEITPFSLRGSNLKPEIKIQDGLWHAEYDRGQVEQVLQNLLINSKQATPEGGTIKVRVSNIEHNNNNNKLNVLKSGKYIKIEVGDQGTGIPKHHLSKIFDPYFTTKQEGSGLGLATSYKILKKHGGLITAENNNDQGAKFSIYLPASEQKAELAEQKETILIKGSGRVLIMDDEEPVRKILNRMLTHLGYETVLTKDGKEAIDVYKREKKTGNTFDFVITDLTVPGGMGGKETLADLLKMDPKAKVICSSGYSNNDSISDYQKLGFVGLLPKPYEMNQLSELLKKL